MRNPKLWAQKTLGYTNEWFELGILTDELCRSQLRDWSKNDDDPAMGNAILHDILRTNWLSDEHFQNICDQIGARTPSRILERAVLFRQLSKESDMKAIDKIARSADSIIQRHIIDNCDIGYETLSYLEQKGHTRAVRNLARQRLKRSASKE